jgi:hypothetical protein
MAICMADGATPNTAVVLMTVCRADGTTPNTAAVLMTVCRADGATPNTAAVLCYSYCVCIPIINMSTSKCT